MGRFFFQNKNRDSSTKMPHLVTGYFLRNVLIDFVIMQTSYGTLTQPRWNFYITGMSAGLFTPAPLQTLQ